MATTKYIEAGSAATQGFQNFTTTFATNGTVSSDAQAVAGSVRSIKCITNGTTGGTAQALVAGVLANAGRRISFYFRFSGTIGGTIDILVPTDSGGIAHFCLALNTSGNLVIQNAAGTVVGTGGTTLSASTDYRITVQYTYTSTSVNTLNILLNGSSEIALTNITMTSNAFSDLYFGQGYFNDTQSTTVAWYFAHIFIDDGTSGDPGNVKVTVKRPNANGTTNGFTTQIGSGDSGYGTGHSPQVNERPLNNANGWSMIGVGSAVTEEYNIENISTGDVDITGSTIVDYVGWVRAKSLASETAQIIINNVTSNISLTSAEQYLSTYATSSTYPAGTGTDIGIITSTTVTTVSLYECGIQIAYIPAVAASTAQGGYMPTRGFFG